VDERRLTEIACESSPIHVVPMKYAEDVCPYNGSSADGIREVQQLLEIPSDDTTKRRQVSA